MQIVQLPPDVSVQLLVQRLDLGVEVDHVLGKRLGLVLATPLVSCKELYPNISNYYIIISSHPDRHIH